MRHALILLVAALVACMPAPARGNASDIDAVCRSAMAPYYGALLASSRGDADGTLRHALILKSRWDEVTRRPAPDMPMWLRDTATGQSLGAAVASKIDSARQHLPRDVAGAHSELEAIRVLLRDARTRHGARTVDDAVTDYHEAMERLSSHIGVSNEIALTTDDFTAIRGDVERAQSMWTKVESFPELAKPVTGWNDVAAATTSVLGTIAKAANRRDATTVQQASHALKNRYFDLLSILSHRQ
jgi:hypothetical protein